MRLFATILIAALPGLAAAQAPAQSNQLLAICSGFLSQGAGGVSGDQQKLCACLVRETPAQLSLQEMSAYAEATAANRAPPAAVTQKMTAIATKCLDEAQKK